MKRDLGDGLVTQQQLSAAAEAVKLEFRSNSRTIRLRCLAVAQVEPAEDGIYALDVSRFGEMDWTWEGARALRRDDDDGYAWSGEIVEVDAVHSRIFVRSGETRPCVGDFLVDPFEFLASLHALYNGDLAAGARTGLAGGLAGAGGGLRGRSLADNAALPHLKRPWSTSWGYLWGPPGTGKTFNAGRQVARALAADPSEKLLVVSTTNRATDEIAISIGRALKELGAEPSRELSCRVGSGADIERFREAGLEEMLVGGEAWLRRRLSVLLREHEATRDAARRAQIWSQVQTVRLALSTARASITETDSRAVVTTSFIAVRDLATKEQIEKTAAGEAPFSTVVIDEAGLVSRAAVAALSLLAARRVLLVGDPKQLSPISRISRILPSSQARWIASSSLADLHGDSPGMHLLVEQHRMHPEIRRAVSEYQYEGKLKDAATVIGRAAPVGSDLGSGPRSIWYVVDDDTEELSHIRAERGPGNKSWVRHRSQAIMERLFRAHPEVLKAGGLFVTPFVAQARAMAEFLAALGADSWRASTTHRQQGAEADVVVFDTVNASSTAWPHDEWQRVINVSISRARHLLVVIASRAEMGEPYLNRLAPLLRPRVLRGTGGHLKWLDVDARAPEHVSSAAARKLRPDALGAQIEARKSMRPILSAEQQRLCAHPLDGKPRLVRGVAGSGKTAVLAHWLARRLAEDDAVGPLWVVYANAALLGLLQGAIESAWASLDKHRGFPWDRVELFHILTLLEGMELATGVRAKPEDPYDYEARAKVLLERPVTPRCKGLFIDEAQDFGETTLAYLTRLVEPSGDDPNVRSVNIFYDNAQNLYRRGTPTWSELGLDMKGRSTVMKESFRATQPVTEFALNVLYRLQPPENDPDHRELVRRDLIDVEQRNGRAWWRVRFNQVHGPPPEFRRFGGRDGEILALYKRVEDWIVKDGVRPGDVRIIVNDPYLRRRIAGELGAALAQHRVRVEEQARQKFANSDDGVIVTTAQSFKGYEGEIVAVPAADKFVARDSDSAGTKKKDTLPASLYVAMTRARSVLYVSSLDRSPGSPSALVVDALQTSIEDLRSAPPEAPHCTPVEQTLELLERVSPEHRDWLRKLLSVYSVETGPILRPDGSIIAEPLFRIRALDAHYAFFATPPSSFVVQELEDSSVKLLVPGQGTF